MKFYIHKEGYLYSGDFTEGARTATEEEINAHLHVTKSVEPVDPSLLAIAEALAAQETRLAKLEGGVPK